MREEQKLTEALKKLIEFIGVTLVTQIMWVTGVQFCNASSIGCVFHPRSMEAFKKNYWEKALAYSERVKLLIWEEVTMKKQSKYFF